MSRSGYQDCDDDFSNWELIKYRGRVASAIRGKRGQKLLTEMLVALDAMSVKELVAHELEMHGQYCALGVVGKQRGLDLSKVDPEDSDLIAKLFDISEVLAREVVYENDEGAWHNNQETSEARWIRMRIWVAKQIRNIDALL